MRRPPQDALADDHALLAKKASKAMPHRNPIVEKALAGLSIEQRIAVKAELARAGILA